MLYSVARTLYFKITSTSFLITFLCPESAMSINRRLGRSSLSRIMMPGLWSAMVLSVFTYRDRNIISILS